MHQINSNTEMAAKAEALYLHYEEKLNDGTFKNETHLKILQNGRDTWYNLYAELKANDVFTQIDGVHIDDAANVLIGPKSN